MLLAVCISVVASSATPAAPSGLRCSIDASSGVPTVQWEGVPAVNLYDVEVASSFAEPAFLSITTHAETARLVQIQRSPGATWVTVRAHAAAAGKEQMIIGWSAFALRVECVRSTAHTLEAPRRAGPLQPDSITLVAATQSRAGRVSLCRVHYHVIAMPPKNQQQSTNVNVLAMNPQAQEFTLRGLQPASAYKIWTVCGADSDGAGGTFASASAVMRTGRMDTTWYEVFRVAENMQTYPDFLVRARRTCAGLDTRCLVLVPVKFPLC